MKKFNYIFVIAIAFFINACGGDGSSAFTQETIDINVSCVTSPSSSDIDTYLTLESGDSIVKDEDGTVVSTYHNSDGDKKVCLNSGKAHIVKN